MKNVLTLLLFCFALIVYGQNEQEPNDAFSDATPITFDAQWSGKIQVAGDEDYFEFEITEPGIISYNLTSVPSGVDLISFIYHPDFTEIRRNISVNEAQGYSMLVSTCEVGEHYLYLSDEYFNTGNLGDEFNAYDQYTFQVDFTPFSANDPCECNNASNTACSIGICDTIQAVVAPWFDDDNIIEDKDYYEIELLAGEEVNVQLANIPSNIRPCITIYNSILAPIDDLNGNIGQPLTFDFTASENGTYYFEVTDCNGNFNAEDPYQLTIGCNLISKTAAVTLSEDLNVFPNPFSKAFSADLQHWNGQDVTLTLFNAQGTPVFHQKTAASDLLTVDVGNLPDGVYFIKMTIGNQILTNRLMKQ